MQHIYVVEKLNNISNNLIDTHMLVMFKKIHVV